MKIPQKTMYLICTIVITLISFFIYIPTLKSDFVWDDVQLIMNPLVMTNSPYSFLFGGGIYYRPILHLSMVLNYSLWHFAPFGYHMTNMLLHTIVSLLVFLLGYHLFKNKAVFAGHQKLEVKDSRRALYFSFIAAILFALNPIHTESVAWISGRTDILATMFLLLAFISYLVYALEGSLISLVLSAIFFLSGLLSKENAIAFIGIAVIYGVIIKMQRKKILLSSITFSGILILYLLLRNAEGAKAIVALPGSSNAFFSLGITIKVFLTVLYSGVGYYFEKLILPFNLSLIPQMPESPLYILVVLLPFFLGGILYFFKHRLEVFFIIWIVISLLPSLPILYTQLAHPVGERYLYLPSVGFSLLLALLIIKINKKAILLFCVLCISLVYTVSTYERLKVWKNDLILWEDTVQKNPYSVNARANYGSALLISGQYNLANKELSTALTQGKISIEQASKILELLGLVEIEQKNFKKAEDYFVNSIKSNNRSSTAYNNLGYLYERMAEIEKNDARMGLLEKAIKNYEEALRLSPTFIQPKYNLGLCYLKMSDYEKAEKYFNLVIESDPLHDLSKKATRFLILIRIARKTGTKIT